MPAATTTSPFTESASKETGPCHSVRHVIPPSLVRSIVPGALGSWSPARGTKRFPPVVATKPTFRVTKTRFVGPRAGVDPSGGVVARKRIGPDVGSFDAPELLPRQAAVHSTSARAVASNAGRFRFTAVMTSYTTPPARLPPPRPARARRSLRQTRRLAQAR